MRVVSFLTGLAMSTLVSFGGGTTYIHNDYGGEVSEYTAKYTQHIFTNQNFHVSGVCASACTLVLMFEKERVCTTEDAEWWFHGPSVNGRPSEEATYLFSIMYPENVKTWFNKYAAHLSGSRNYAVLKGSQLIRMGWASRC